MAVATINPIEDKRWLKFVTDNTNSAIFHHPAWLKVLNRQYGYRVFAVVCTNENDEITAGIPFCEVTGLMSKKKWVSLPFSDYSYPLYCSAGQVNELTQYVVDEYKNGKINSAEIFWGVDSAGEFQNTSSYVYHITDINKDEKSLMSSFHRTKNQGIAKSVKQGLTAKFAADIEAIKTFYRLHLKTRKKLGVPIQPAGFFYAIYDEIIKNGLGFLVIISKDNIEMAAGLFMGFGNTLTYKYNASDPEYLQYRPNNLIIWAAMQEGIKRGFKNFDFGKSDLSNEGLRSFKNGWAGIEKPLFYSYLPSAPSETSSFNFVKDKVVAPLIKSSPDFVCKVIGEVAYKYFPSV